MRARTYPRRANGGVSSGEGASSCPRTTGIETHDAPEPPYLRQLASEGRGPDPLPSGRRLYSIEDIENLRQFLDGSGTGARRYSPQRREGDGLQVISVMNFKGGSGKTTTAAHLAEYLAFRGYRVLAIDLDPQASLSALFGLQPELDVADNDTLYGAIRYDDRRPSRGSQVLP